jgi:hypothetical protein
LVKGIFFTKVRCILCALRIKFEALCLKDGLGNTEKCLKSSERIHCPWEDAETDSIKDVRNRLKHEGPMPLARPRNGRARPLKPPAVPIKGRVGNISFFQKVVFSCYIF